MADRLNVTELDFDSIKTNLKNYLRQQSEFQDYDFEGSGLNVLLDILAYNTHYNAYYLNMVANESFMDSAALRNSVVSHAKRVGYTPRSVSAPRAVVNIAVQTTNSTPGSLTIPRGYYFLSSQIDGKSYRFVTLESYSVNKTGNNFVFTSIPIYEGQFASYSYNNSYSNNPKQLFTIPDSNVDTNTLRVSVRQSSSNNQTIVYTKATEVLNLASTSTVYYLQEGRNGQYDVYFGDDIISKKIPDGGVVTLEYLISNGSEANKANSFTSTISIGGFSAITINPISASSGGSPRESVDQIKFAAPLNLLSQNRAVTKNDYIKIIQQKYPSFEAVNVWGGEENDPPVYGKVFISAKPKLGFEVTDTEKDFVKNTILKPISVLTVTPEIVDIDYNYLKVNSTVFYERSKLNLSDSELKAGLKTTIENYCATNLNKFNSYFKYSGLETVIDNYSPAIVSNEIELFVAKKFRPILNLSDSYMLDFGFELNRGTTSDNFYSSPDFTVIDEEGVSRKCFFEEIPSSFTGLESVTITNPGFGYTSTPTVTVVGDGSGATARAVIVNGKLSAIEVLTPGVGYTTAAIQITGGGGSLAAASAVLEGRYGKIRISYYKTDEISSQSTKVVINKNKNDGVVGTIDYLLGKIMINNFQPTSVNNSFGDIMVHIRPKISIIQSKLNKMLVLDEEDPTSVTIKTVII
jgi:hypothetical protein